MKIPRISLRSSMLAIAVLAFGLAAVRGLLAILRLGGLIIGFAEDTYYGPNTGLLNVGQAAVLTEDYRAAPAREVIKPTGRTGYKSAMYDSPARTPMGDRLVAVGTRCIVMIDPAWDEDSCHPDRPIAIELSQGENRGGVVVVPRRILRRQ
jgi:hypothetical protein